MRPSHHDPASFRLSIPKALAIFSATLAIMEGAGVFSVSQAGDWGMLLFLQPVCLLNALIVGVWLGAMATTEGPVGDTAAEHVRPRAQVTTRSRPAHAGAVA